MVSVVLACGVAQHLAKGIWNIIGKRYRGDDQSEKSEDGAELHFGDDFVADAVLRPLRKTLL